MREFKINAVKSHYDVGYYYNDELKNRNNYELIHILCRLHGLSKYSNDFNISISGDEEKADLLSYWIDEFGI